LKLTALLLSLLLLVGYAYVLFKFSTELIKAVSTIKSKVFRVVYSISLLLPGLALFFLLKDEKFVYYWDYSGYWYKAITFSNEFFTNPFQALKSVYHSVRHEEYNSLPNVLLAPANHVLGLNFNNYVFSIYLVYLVPFALVFSSLIIRLNPEADNKFKLAVPFFILCFAPCLIPIRYGFLDIVGLVYIALVLSILVRSNYFRELNIKRAIISGLLLLLLIFNRRWYAFWFVAFYFAVFAVNFIAAIKTKNYKMLINTCINLGIAGIVPMAIMLLFFYPYFEMTVLKDYKDIYSAYRGASIMHQADNFNHFFGLFIILTAIAGIVLSLKKQKTLTGFFAIGSVIITVLFVRVNDFGGLQHYYLLVPFFMFFFLQAAAYFSARKYVLVALFALLLVNNCFVFALNPVENSYAFSKIEGKAFFRPDYDEVKKIANRVTELHNQGKYVYCLASAGALNEDIIKHIKLPDVSNPVFKLQRTQHLDKRDRFPNELFLADYVITTLPAELHLGAENQKLIAYFNEEIMNGSLKQHYEKVQEYQLKDNVKAYLMKRTSSLNNTEIQSIHDYFKSAYPEYEQMFAINRTILKTSDITIGDGFGIVAFENESTINLCPGSTRPSEISFMFDENDKTISFTATFNNKETLVKECNSEKDGEVNLIIKENGTVIKTIYLTHRKDEKIMLDVSGKKKITLSVDKGRNEDYCDWFRLVDFQIKQQ
jgi:hypothetical protein